MSFRRDTGTTESVPITNNTIYANLHPNDVIIGRKKLSEKQIGNQRLQQLAQQKTHEYRHSFYRQQKKLVAVDIIEEIKKLNPPGRFLKPENKSSSAFREIDRDESITKVCHILRALVKKAGKGDSTTNHPNNQNEQNMHPIEVTSSATNAPTCSESSKDLKKGEPFGKRNLEKGAKAEQHSTEGMPMSMSLNHGDYEKKRPRQSVDLEASKTFKYEANQVVLSISYLGKSFLARPTFSEETRRIIQGVAELSEAENGVQQLPNMVGNILTRIEELEEESQVVRGRVAV